MSPTLTPTPIPQKLTLGDYSRELWKFSRPHTIVGTSLSVLALFVLAIAEAQTPISTLNVGQVLGTLIACLLGNIYIVGLNQLEDIDIDRINKPSLPLASGRLTVKQGRWIVGLAGVGSLALSWSMGWVLGATVSLSLAIGTAYSLPPIRLKQFPLLAALCILGVRGFIVNLGIFSHFSQVFGGSGNSSPNIYLLAGFVMVFSIAIALFKDVPDLDGDRQYQIQTFTLILGKQRIFEICLWLIGLSYLGMMGAAFLDSFTLSQGVAIAGHGGLLLLLILRSRRVDLEDKEAIARFYQFIWKLFFLEYVLFPVSVLLR
jgi:homogentisate phytyltransferase/homogentisate geranylgeranyltransferase